MGIPNSLALRSFEPAFSPTTTKLVFFETDPDCVGISGAIPWALNRQWAELVAASGSSLFLSPKPGVLNSDEKKELRKLLAEASKGEIAAEPLDWLENSCPSEWLIHGEKRKFQWFEADGGEPDFLPRKGSV